MKRASAKEAAEALRNGEVALVPTETVVGLVASGSGLSRLSGIKERDPEKPVALLCASVEQAFAFAASARVPPLAEKLARLYWPGPLTLVLDRPGGGTIGVRVPDHRAVQALLAAYGGPLYATSANISGETAPTALEDVNPRIVCAADLTLEGEPGSGEASAVVDLSRRRVRLLRATAELTKESLRKLAEE